MDILWWTKSRRAQSNTDYETWIEGGVVPTLNAFDNGDVRATTIVFTSSSFANYSEGVGTLRSAGGDLGGGSENLAVNNTVRRLTPIECERLQGFPDNWTDCVSDSQRYKQMGNAVTVNVVEWIGKRL